jgi:integrase/recombinase XerD
MRIRAFLNYMVEEGIVKENVAKKIKRLKEDVEMNVFTDEQIHKCLATIEGYEEKRKVILHFVDIS